MTWSTVSRVETMKWNETPRNPDPPEDTPASRAAADLIPATYRPAGIDQPLRAGLPKMMQAWEMDEFVLDPSRITVYIGGTGIEGDTFKRNHLMDRYGVQINKTSRNTVLFMTTIGTTRSSVAYLIEVLVSLVRELDARVTDMSPAERAAHERAVLRLTSPSAPPGRVDHLRHALPAGLPRARARPDVQPTDPGVHAEPGHARGPWVPARPWLPGLRRQSPGNRGDRPARSAARPRLAHTCRASATGW
jgi:hypothetical protein